MNIAIAGIVEFNPKTGGTERVSATLAENLKQHGHTVFFVAAAKAKFAGDYTPVAEQIILPCPNIHCCEENIQRFSQFITEKKISVVLNQFGNAADFSNLCCEVKKRTGTKLISAIHTDPAYEMKLYKADISPLQIQSPFIRKVKLALKNMFPFKLRRTMKQYSAMYRRLYCESDAVALLSDFYIPVFRKITAIDDTSKLVAIPNPLSFHIEKNENFPKEKQMLWIGRFDSLTKRPERLVQIWSLIEKNNPDWKLLFLGDGDCKPDVENLVKRLQLKNVKFEGFADPVSQYKKSAIICMTSTFEGMPMVLLEAMQFGAVPVAFDSFESIHDIIEDGKNGYLIKPFDLKQYAACLETLINDSEKRHSISRNAANSLTDIFDAEMITKKWITLFENILL